MNRRTFLRALIAIPLAAKLPEIGAPLIDSTRVVNYEELAGEYVTWIRYTMNLYVSNPARCVIIDNIGED